VQCAALVRLAAGGWVESVRDETRSWPVLVHQILALTQQHGGISAERAWDVLSRVSDFRGISKEEYLALVEHMKEAGYLLEAGGLLSMGLTAEKAFGKKNFLELYAVFSTPVLYKVQTETKRDVGSLEQAFVDRLVEDMSTFLLGGRAWIVSGVNHDERLVRVRPAPRGKKPSWGGFVPQFLGFEVCQEMRAVLTSDDALPFLDARAASSLSEWRGELGQLLKRRSPTQFDGDVLTWWTFAGGRINQTLKYALEWKGGWKVVPDNFAIKVSGDGLGFERFEEVLRELRDPAFWEASETRTRLLAMVPEYRLSKFQRVLPDRLQVEMLGAYLLDFEGTAAMLAKGSDRATGNG
jgi:ATP-dependent Lhr-like helicase